MNTKFIGIKEFRKNVSSYAQKAQTKDARYIVMNRNRPLFEIKPFASETNLDSLFQSIASAQKDIRRGDLYSHDEILELLS